MIDSIDSYLWLEEINGEKSLNFVRKENEITISKLSAHPLFNEIHRKALEIYGSDEKVPYVWFEGKFLYNLWSDEKNIQGVLRRTSVDEFLNVNTKWETVVDFDQLSKDYNSKIVFNAFIPNQSHTRALISFSHGGSDANYILELDLLNLIFIKDGFFLPESKGSAHWVDDDTIWVERCFDEESVTTSGYARTIRELKRGQRIDEAKILFEVQKEDLYSYSKIVYDGNNTHLFWGRVIDFYNIEEYYIQNKKKYLLELPTQTEDHGILNGEYILTLKTDWNEYKTGDIISYNLTNKKVDLVFSPNKNESCFVIKKTKNGLYLIIDEDVKSRLYLMTKVSNQWKKDLINLPHNGALGALSVNENEQEFFVSYHSFNQPSTYYFGKNNKIEVAARISSSFFKHEEIEVHQNFVSSSDGEKIPYFLVYKKGIKLDGSNPTILYGYGGFEVSLKPSFDNNLGYAWLSRGGVYVIANIRGGGEYGPKWHQAALKNNRQKAYDDFFAIASDLIQKKITSYKHLGAWGASNGGLLMGVCYTMRPDLFKAINCMVPLLDMHRYHQLLAGASWIAEYGNPDDENDGAYIRKISPYQNIKEISNPPIIYLNTSTKDDRVHPGHARKFAAKLKEKNLPYLYYENMDGGHAGASNFKENALNFALDMCFFWETLK